MAKSTKQSEENPRRFKLSSSAMFHDFKAEPTFVGRYIGEHIGMIEDQETHEKHEGVIGFDFINDDGIEVIISKSHSITKSLTTEDEKGVMFKDRKGIFEITFIDKITNSKGKPFNRFDVFFNAD
jgi:hypothetical protein